MARIIIVEDDDILADIIVQTLSDAGHFVDAVDNGDEAVAAVKASEADLVIVDYALPGKTGMQVLRDIRNLPFTTNLPIMMMTAHTGSILARRAEQAGADDYITKPFDPRELVRRAEALLTWSSVTRSVCEADVATVDPAPRRAAAADVRSR